MRAICTNHIKWKQSSLCLLVWTQNGFICWFIPQWQKRNSRQRSHVVRNKDGIELIVEEAVAEVHALFLTAGIDWHNARVNDDDDADNLVLLLDDSTRYKWNDVSCLILTWLQFNDGHQQVAPCENGTDIIKQPFSILHDMLSFLQDSDGHMVI